MLLEFVQKAKSFIKGKSVVLYAGYLEMPLRHSTILLIGLGSFLVCRDFSGSQIECYDNSIKAREYVNQVCWNKGTYTLDRTHEGEPRPGIYPIPINGNVLTKTYYRYTWMILLVTGFISSFPLVIWRHMEAGMLEFLLMGLSRNEFDLDKRQQRQLHITNYLRDAKLDAALYLMRYNLFKLITIASTILNVYIMDLFLDGKFLLLGLSVFGYEQNESGDQLSALDSVFPLSTSCIVPMFGYSGSKVTYGALCELPINDLNRKVFLFLWFWFTITLAFSAVCMTLEFIVEMCPFIHMIELRVKGRLRRIQRIRLTRGQVFVLIQLGRNLAELEYRNLLAAICPSGHIHKS